MTLALQILGTLFILIIIFWLVATAKVFWWVVWMEIKDLYKNKKYEKKIKDRII